MSRKRPHLPGECWFIGEPRGAKQRRLLRRATRALTRRAARAQIAEER